jgi:hypothetical protein
MRLDSFLTFLIQKHLSTTIEIYLFIIYNKFFMIFDKFIFIYNLISKKGATKLVLISITQV